MAWTAVTQQQLMWHRLHRRRMRRGVAVAIVQERRVEDLAAHEVAAPRWSDTSDEGSVAAITPELGEDVVVGEPLGGRLGPTSRQQLYGRMLTRLHMHGKMLKIACVYTNTSLIHGRATSR